MLLVIYQARSPFSPDNLYLLDPHAKKGSSKTNSVYKMDVCCVVVELLSLCGAENKSWTRFIVVVLEFHG